MFDHDMWMRRGAERQKIVEELKSVIGKEEIDSPELAYELAVVILGLLAVAGDMEISPFTEPGTKSRQAALALLKQKIVPTVEKFSNANEERYKIMTELHEWLSGLIIGQFVSAFGMWESATFRK